MKIIETPDTDHAASVRQALHNNNYYCPCKLTKTPDTRCMCKDFRNQMYEGPCHCGLYIKVED